MLKYPGEGLGVLHYLRMRDAKYLCICVGSPVPSFLENAIKCASKFYFATAKVVLETKSKYLRNLDESLISHALTPYQAGYFQALDPPPPPPPPHTHTISIQLQVRSFTSRVEIDADPDQLASKKDLLCFQNTVYLGLVW